MVQNAKDFNDKRSLIYEDAERVRKGASNWFVRHNPAYNDRNYVAKPTPIPGESNGTPSTPAPPITLKFKNKAAPIRTPAASATPIPSAKDELMDGAADVEGEAGVLSDYRGKTFQQAQDQLIEELIDYVEYISQRRRQNTCQLTVCQAWGRHTHFHTIPLPTSSHPTGLLPSYQISRLAEGCPEANTR
jgi:hypothetical protein